MAIDILSRMGSSPIVVGDEGDMERVRGLVREDDATERTVLLFAPGERAEDPEKIRLSAATEDNLLATLDFIAVALTSDDRIAWAYVCQLGHDGLSLRADLDLRKQGGRGAVLRKLNESEIKSLAEDLVAGDFNLDFLRGNNDHNEAPNQRESETQRDSDAGDPAAVSPSPS